MKTMKKAVVCLLSLVLVLTMLTGCETYMAYTFSIDNGDSIKVSLDTSDKFKISSEVPFTISQDGKELTHGSFIHGEAYDEYVQALEADEKSVISDSGVKDGNKYTYWIYNGEEFNYVVLVEGSNTGVLLGNNVSPDSAMECFNRLTISVDED